MRFRCRIPVRFGDIDHAGVAYYPTLLDHCHVAFEEFFEKGLGRPYPRVAMKEHLGFPTVRLEGDFRKPLRFGDVLEVEVTVERLGRSSVTFRYRAFRTRSKTPAFEILCTTACVDLRSFRSKPIPEVYRSILMKHLEHAPDTKCGKSM